MKVCEETSIKELKSDPVFCRVLPFMIYSKSGDGAGRFQDDAITLREIQEKDPSWNARAMAYGLNMIAENASLGKPLILDVYEKEEIRKAPDKEAVKLIYFPAKKPGKERKTAILAAGGAYGSVCSLPESFPVAAKMSEAGIDVFCLNYRVADGAPLFPRPMEDLRAAYRFLISMERELEIDMNHYAVGGFSAGGHLAACYGIDALGYASIGARKPELMILAYPLVNAWDTVQTMPAPVRAMMLKGYFGDYASEGACRIYNVDQSLDRNYPATYFIQSEDDPIVPIWNTQRLEKALQDAGVSYCYEIAKTSKHGFGLGLDTDAEGWVERMLDFWEELEA